jgi:hypothetical protein
MKIRWDKVKKIRNDYRAARDKGKDLYYAIVYAVEQNLDCMSKEFYNAIWPLHSFSLKTESSQKQQEQHGRILQLGAKDLWRMAKHHIAKDNLRWEEIRIISVMRQIQQLDGKVVRFRAEGFPVGRDAEEHAERREKVAKGVMAEVKKDREDARDPNKKRRLTEAKRRRQREIQGL